MHEFRSTSGACLDEVDQRVSESLDVLGFAAGDDVAVGNRRLVDHLRSGIAQVGADRRPAGRGPATQQVRFDQQPRAVTDRADRLFLPVEGFDQLDDASMDPQLVRIAHAARQDQRIEIVGVRFVNRRSGQMVLPGSSWTVAWMGSA